MTTGQIDLHAYIGLGGITIIESAVEYIVTHTQIPRAWAPVLAVGLGVGLNLLLALNFHFDLLNSVVVGVFTGVLASGWHEATK